MNRMRFGISALFGIFLCGNLFAQIQIPHAKSFQISNSTINPIEGKLVHASSVKCASEEDLKFRGLAYRLLNPKAQLIESDSSAIIGSAQLEILTCRKNAQGEIGWNHAESFTYSYASTVDGQPAEIGVLFAGVELMHVTRYSEYLGSTELHRAPKETVNVDFAIPVEKGALSTEPIRTVFFLKATKFYQINGGEYNNVGPVKWGNIQLWVHLQKIHDNWSVKSVNLL